MINVAHTNNWIVEQDFTSASTGSVQINSGAGCNLTIVSTGTSTAFSSIDNSGNNLFLCDGQEAVYFEDGSGNFYGKLGGLNSSSGEFNDIDGNTVTVCNLAQALTITGEVLIQDLSTNYYANICLNNTFAASIGTDNCGVVIGVGNGTIGCDVQGRFILQNGGGFALSGGTGTVTNTLVVSGVVPFLSVTATNSGTPGVLSVRMNYLTNSFVIHSTSTLDHSSGTYILIG